MEARFDRHRRAVPFAPCTSATHDPGVLVIETTDELRMAEAIELATSVRTSTAPNPWVGAVVVSPDGSIHNGATEPPGGRHAEVGALDAAREVGGDAATHGATVYVTLEPCAHVGRTGPCADALIDAGVRRVVVGLTDPDPLVAGAGMARLRDAGVAVETGCRAEEITDQLTPYLHHRRTGRPWVILKLAATLDGRTAAPDGSSQWITGAEARADAHRLRAESQAVIVGAGTVTADDPSLTTRLVEGPDPRRVVLGRAPSGARVHPCDEWTTADGDLGELLDTLGDDGVLQVLVEGGATVAGSFHREGLVDHYVIYLAPALMGGSAGPSLVGEPGVKTISDLWRGEIIAVMPLGGDLRVDLRPPPDDRRR